MSRYLKEAEHVEAMTVFYGPEVPPHQHTVWTGDFMAMCKHDIACPVCFDAHAIIERDVTPGRYRQSAQPCGACQSDGWTVARLPRWMRFLLGDRP